MKSTAQLALKLFVLPWDIIADRLGAAEPDDRTMIRTMIDMLLWNVVVFFR